MAKYLLFTLILFFTGTSVYGQWKMKLYFKDGTEKTDMLYIKKENFRKKGSREKISFDKVDSFDVFEEEGKIHYKVFNARKYSHTKRIIKKYGRVGYNGDRIEVIYVMVGAWSSGAAGMSTSHYYNEAYVKRKDDSIAYNMGYIFGAGQKGIKSRVRAYFKDCPALIEKVEDNEIKKQDTEAIARFYDTKCIK